MVLDFQGTYPLNNGVSNWAVQIVIFAVLSKSSQHIGGLSTNQVTHISIHGTGVVYPMDG